MLPSFTFMQRVRMPRNRNRAGYVIDTKPAEREGDFDYFKVAFIEPGEPLTKPLIDVGKVLWVAHQDLEVVSE